MKITLSIDVYTDGFHDDDFDSEADAADTVEAEITHILKTAEIPAVIKVTHINEKPVE